MNQRIEKMMQCKAKVTEQQVQKVQAQVSFDLGLVIK